MNEVFVPVLLGKLRKLTEELSSFNTFFAVHSCVNYY